MLAVHGLVIVSRFYMSYGLYEPWATLYAVSRSALGLVGACLLAVAALLLATRSLVSIARRHAPNPLLVALEAVTVAACATPRASVTLHTALGLLAAVLLLAASAHYARASRVYERAMLKVR